MRHAAPDPSSTGRRSTALLLLLLLVACDQQPGPDPGWQRMLEQPRFDRYAVNPVFADRATLQAPPPGSVPRERPARLPGAHAEDGSYRAALPLPPDLALLERGRELFDRNCAVCHGPLADGDSYVAARMHQVPPADLQQPGYRDAPLGRLYEVATEGYGAMPGFAALLDDGERWAIVAWLRCLQHSRHVVLGELDPERRRVVEELLP